MLQNPSATTMTTAEMEENVRKISRITLTRARAYQALLASTVKLVSTVTQHSCCIPDYLKTEGVVV